MKIGSLAALCIAGLVATSAAGAADIHERTIKVGIGLTADHPQGQAITRFAELVDQKSDGKIKVKLFAGGSIPLRTTRESWSRSIACSIAWRTFGSSNGGIVVLKAM